MRAPGTAAGAGPTTVNFSAASWSICSPTGTLPPAIHSTRAPGASTGSRPVISRYSAIVIRPLSYSAWAFSLFCSSARLSTSIFEVSCQSMTSSS